MTRYFRLVIWVAFLSISVNSHAQCPTVEVVMVDACPLTDEKNEFVIVYSGDGFNTNTLQFDFASQNNTGSPSNSDLNTPGSPCGLALGNIAAYTGCTNLISIGPGYEVPANSMVIVQISGGTATNTYDFTSLCGTNQCVYVLGASCERLIGAFTNFQAFPANPIRENTFTIDGCPTIFDIIIPNVPNSDGAYFIPSTNTYGSNGCVSPPTLNSAPLPASVNQPANIEVCGGQQVSSIFTGTGTSYEWTNTNTSIGLGASGTGDINFTSANVASTQVGTITVFPQGPCPGTPRNFTITVNPSQTPTFTQVPAICSGGSFTLPSTSNNGITGNWAPAINNTMTMTYTFTPDPLLHPCGAPVTMEVIVNPNVTPNFIQIGPFCSGATFTLPLTSPNGITGIWSPAINNTMTNTYTFTPDPVLHPCANMTQMTVVVNPASTPDFMQIGPICSGTPFTLPLTSPNGITGTWSPLTNITTTTPYTFTPDPIAHPCANPATMTVVVIPQPNPVFTQIDPICFGGVINLPSISNNGISGSWSPAINNTMTNTYTFSPDLIAHPCANIANMTVVVNMITTPTFTQIEPICQGSLFTLPLTSTNGISGTWSPLPNTTTTTPYTFTPDPILHPCASQSMMIVEVETPKIPVLGPFGPYCSTESSVTLPLVQDGISGSWSGVILNGNMFDPSLLSPGLYTITFNPASGECAVPNNISIEVIAIPIGNISGNPILCPDQCGLVTFNFSGGSGIYNISLNINAGIFNFNFPMVGVSNSTVLNICSNNGIPFDPSTNTLNIPTFIPSGTYTLNLINIASLPSGACTIGTVGVPGSISITTIDAPQASTASLNSCDVDQDGAEIFDLTSIEDIVKNNDAINTVSWYTDEAGVNIISFPSSFSSGNTTVYAQISNPDGCVTTVPVSLILDPPVVLNLTDFSSCINGPLIDLPSIIEGYTGIWSGGNIVGGSQFNPAGLSTGNYPITFTPTGGFCVAAAPVNVNITSSGPVPLNSPIATTCSGDASAVLSNLQGGISGVWSGSAFLSGNVFNISASGAGSFPVTFTPNGSGSCFSPNTTEIVVIPNIVLTPVNFSDVCSGSAVINLANVVDGENGSWSGNSQIVANTFNPNTTAGDYPLVFTPIQNCVTGFTTNIKVLPFITLTPPPLGPTCVNGATIPLPASINSVSGRWELNGSPITTFNPGVSGTGDFTLVFIPNPAECALPVDVIISVGQINAGKDSLSTFCKINVDTINLNSFLSGGTTPGGQWKLNNTVIVNPAKYPVAGLSGGTHIFTYLLNDALCGRDTAFITFNIVLPNNAGNNSQSMLCSDNSSSIDFNTFLGIHTAGGNWIQPFGINIDLSNSSQVDLSSLNEGIFVFKYIISAGVCPSDTSETVLDIKKYNSAGTDVISTLCLGTEIDLLNLVNSTFNGGVILNPSGVPGLSGSIWNSTGLVAGNYTFLHEVTNPAPCPADTSTLIINLAASVTAGNDVTDFFCENETVDLNDFLSANASAGGKFFQNGTEIPNGIFATINQSNIQFIYTVGDGLTCPADTAIITLGPVLKPIFNITGLKDICEDDCQEITINHNIPAGAQIAINMTTTTGIVDNISNPVANTNPVNLLICPVKNGPYSFNNPPTGETLTIRINNITLQNNQCVFSYSDEYQLSTIPLPTKTVSRTLCKGDVLIVGNDIYTETNPSGISVIPSVDPEKCDSLFSVNLSFVDPSPVTRINTTTCDQNYSLLVGNSTFNISNPTGSVMLKNIQGCDSMIVVSLTYNTSSTGTFISSTCDANEVFKIGNQEFSRTNPEGSVTLPGGNILGCDSVITVKINYINPSVFEINTSTCDDTYILNVGGQTFSKQSPTGSVTLAGMSVNGCDSIVNVSLKYLTIPNGNFTLSTCDDDFTFTGGNIVFNKTNPAGSYVLPSAAINGCDSIVNVQINFSDFNIANTLKYNCDGSNPEITLNLASHPGPYTINVDGNDLATIQNLPYITTLAPGNHLVMISTDAGCVDNITVNVEDTQGPDVELTQIPNADGTISILVIAPQNVIYNLKWSPSSTLSCNNCFDPIANPAEKTTYTLDYNYSADCEGQKMISVQRINTDISIPNIFSPDNDGANDVFYVILPENINGTVKNMAIYDRWGNQMFSVKDVPANQPASGWEGMFNGSFVQPGVYVYFIEVQIEGKSGSDKYAGSITLVR